MLPWPIHQIAQWSQNGIPEDVLVDIYLQLRDVLPRHPTQLLRRDLATFDGLVYRFRITDRNNRAPSHRRGF